MMEAIQACWPRTEKLENVCALWGFRSGALEACCRAAGSLLGRKPARLRWLWYVHVPMHVEGPEDNSEGGHLLLRHLALALVHQLGQAD